MTVEPQANRTPEGAPNTGNAEARVNLLLTTLQRLELAFIDLSRRLDAVEQQIAAGTPPTQAKSGDDRRTPRRQ